MVWTKRDWYHTALPISSAAGALLVTRYTRFPFLAPVAAAVSAVVAMAIIETVDVVIQYMGRKEARKWQSTTMP